MAWTRINVMLPTYKRSDMRLRYFVDSALKTCASVDNICFTFVCNEQDTETHRYLTTRLRGVADFCVLMESLQTPHLAKYFNQAYKDTEFKDDSVCVSMFGDDFVFKTDRWDEILLQWVNDYDGIGIFYGDDMNRFHGDLATMFVTTRKYIEAQGHDEFMCELFPIDEIDVIHHDIAKAVGRLFYLPHVKILHDHSTLPGKMDAVWTRMREQLHVVDRNRPQSADEIAKRVAALKKNVNDDLHPKLPVIMTTYNRDKLLHRTIMSYNAAYVVPDKIDVYDDCSYRATKSLIGTMHGAVLHEGTEHVGDAGKTPMALADQFSNPNVNAVVVLDSDCELFPTWYVRAWAVYRQMLKTKNVAAVSLFNPFEGQICKDPDIPGVVRREHLGGLGMIVTRDYWERYIKGYHEKYGTWARWDNQGCLDAIADGMVVGAVSPSVIQHIGLYDGSHVGPNNKSYAEDYIGNMIDVRPVAVDFKAPVEKVLVSLQGRYGDTILGSLIVNMIRDAGYIVDWLTLPVYHDLVNLTAPGIRVILNGADPSSTFSHTDTQTMREMYPGYKYYVNLQPGAPENHGKLLASGMNMAFFCKQIAERVLGRELPDDLKAYRRLSREKVIDIYGFTPVKPLALIVPDVISIPNAMTQEWMDEQFEELSKTYTVRYLVKKRPEGKSWPYLKNRYIFNLSFEDCLFLIKDAALLVANDSGLAWAAIYADGCKKKIMHRRKRLGETNMRFSDFDDTYEDITVD